jgi:hypothetical protein
MAILGTITHGSLAQFGLPAAKLLVKRFEHTSEPNLPTVLGEHPRLIHVMNHGPMLAPYVAGVHLAHQLAVSGGADRRPFVAVHRRLFMLPGVRQLIEGGFGAIRPLTFKDIVDGLRDGPYHDFLVLPEGDNEFFGDMRTIRPFKSHRFIELAVELGIPILISAHRGTEDWALSLRLDDRTTSFLSKLSPTLAQRFADDPIFNIQGIPLPIHALRMRSSVFVPTLQPGELSPNPRQRRLQILHESRAARAIMQRLLDELDAE